MALPDPESAYKMMTVINGDDVYYKAQFSELSQMKSAVFQMQDAGQGLGSISLSTGIDSIKSQLQDFVGQYNRFIQRFDPDMQQGGLLADTQAAEASRFELEQNVNNRFFGAKDGVHGLSDLGITIDSNTRLASLDATKLDLLLATNKQGVVDTVQEFSANFTKSASLLNADGNFILKQLDNLNRAINFITDNKPSLQAEFGTGNAAKPAGQVAQALAAYNQTYGV
jgi:flagellar capping protein FliD